MGRSTKYSGSSASTPGAAFFQRGPQRCNFADRVRRIEDALFHGGAVLEEQEPVAVGRVVKGSFQSVVQLAGNQPMVLP